jgi:ribosomal protein S12 methylthiotransferase|tara:strand:- start:838 stop:981 length:144 start_codon:yes stop_codon:yes gene_type:complete
LVALGCPKNTVDAEVMLGDLQRYGMRIVAKPEEADIVCTVADRTKST